MINILKLVIKALKAHFCVKYYDISYLNDKLHN
jgi:hypothetical protein